MTVAKEIRTKIAVTKSTQKITKAMQMVAASKMRKTQDRMAKARPYANKILQVIGHLARGHAEYHHSFLITRQIKRVGCIIVTSDRGLCGGLNTNLLKTAITSIKQWKEQNIDVDLCLIGGKGEAFFRRVGGRVIAQRDHLGDAPTLEDFIGVVQTMLQAYTNNEIDALYIVSNEFINTMRQEPRMEQLIPMVPAQDERLQHYWDYIYEPDRARVLLDMILGRYIESLVYRAVIENIACEQAARMMAMKNATESAADLIDELSLAYNKARQASITRELSEIVAGAAAV